MGLGTAISGPIAQGMYMCDLGGTLEAPHVDLRGL